MASIKIGPEFFKKAFNDYADRYWAFVREIYQNGADAKGTSRIEFTIVTGEDGNTVVTVENDGSPMTRDILVDKLLSLGSSGKGFESTVGGFGKAKEILLFAHRSYTVHTGDMLVDGSGGEYAIDEAEFLHGTRTTVVWFGDCTDRLNNMVRTLAGFAQWDGALYLNGERLSTNLKKGARRKEFGWGVIYSNKSFENRLVVRMGGIPMFTRYCSFPGCLVVELKGKSSDVLTSNRDYLSGVSAEEFSAFITEVAVDKRSALREVKAEYKRYQGDKLKAEREAPRASEITLDKLVNIQAIAASCGISAPVQSPVPSTDSVDSIEESRVSVGYEFILKNTTGMEIPEYYRPGDTFSKYSQSLLRVWVGCLLKLHEILDKPGTFSVGFILDDEREAEFERGDFGNVYYLNPAVVVSQKDKPQCRSFRARYTGAWTARHQLLALAAHEVVHGLYNLGMHDEEYAGRLTDVMGVVFANLSKFNPIFRE